MKKIGDIMILGIELRRLTDPFDWWEWNVRFRKSYFVADTHFWNRSTKTTWRWNSDKAHRCPKCHAVVDDGEPSSSWKVYICCRCAIHFARWPVLAPFLPLTTCQYIRTGECPHQQPKEES